jgi:hypothetical protein
MNTTRIFTGKKFSEDRQEGDEMLHEWHTYYCFDSLHSLDKVLVALHHSFFLVD